MQNITIFEKKTLPSHCYMYDALLWLAFQKIPDHNYALTLKKRKEYGLDEDIDINVSMHSGYETLSYFDKKILIKNGLPEHPDAYFIERDMRFPWILNKTTSIILDENMFNFDEKSLDVFKRASLKYTKQIEEFDCELNSFLDPFIKKLIKKLKTGKIKALGILHFHASENCIEDWDEFVAYWTEHGENDRKMRFEKEKVFGIGRRLATWSKNYKPKNQTKSVNITESGEMEKFKV